MFDIKNHVETSEILSHVRKFPFVQGHKSNDKVEKELLTKFIAFVNKEVESLKISGMKESDAILVVAGALQQRRLEIVSSRIGCVVYKRNDKRKEYLEHLIEIHKEESDRLINLLF